MSIYKRGAVYWYKFMWHGAIVRESTKQGNDKTARDKESEHRARLVAEYEEAKKARARLACAEVARCHECEKLFNADKSIKVDTNTFCSDACCASWKKKHTHVPTLSEFLVERVEPWAKVRPSWLWYRSGIRPLLQCKDIAGRALASITSEVVAGYAAHRSSLQVGTINRELRVLRRILRLAVEWGVLDRAPQVQMLRGEKRRERVVGDEEFARYLTCASPLLADVALVLNDSGLRPDECHRLDWSDIAFVNGRHGKLRVRFGKTKAARRELPLTPRVRAVLEARWNYAGKPEEGWVWTAPTKSGHIDHSTLKKQHRRALKLSGVRPFVLYSLRHSFATCIAPRVDAWSLCKIMGWSSLSVAMTYIHPSDDRVLEAFSGVGGHNFGHTDNSKELPGAGDVSENIDAQ